MYRESQKRKYAFEESLVLYARLLFIHIIRDYEMMAIVPGYSNCNMDNNIVAILGYISTNYNIVSLQELAGFFCYNESYLSRLLKYHTGKTFNTIVNELKLEHAREMLENTDKTIGQISQEVGCFDSSHLSKKFNKRYGISPKEYREKSRHK